MNMKYPSLSPFNSFYLGFYLMLMLYLLFSFKFYFIVVRIQHESYCLNKFFSKGNNHQSEKATCGMGENIHRSCIL